MDSTLRTNCAIFKASDACFCALYLFFFYLRLEQTIGEANWLSPTGDVGGWLHRTAARRWYCLYQRQKITLKFMTAKGNIHNLETAFMWTVKSSNHLHSRILDFSSPSLILLVVSEMVWIFSSPWCFSIFSAFFFCHVELFHAVIISKAYRKIFLFLDLKPLPVFFFLYFLLRVSSAACSSWMWYRHFAHSIRSHLGCLFPGWQRLRACRHLQLAAVTFCYLHIVREADGLRNNRRLECCMMDVQDLTVEIQSIQLPGRG